MTPIQQNHFLDPLRANQPLPTEAKPVNEIWAIESIGVGVLFLLFCLLIQARSGSWNADFGFYPDEASHFIGSVMLRDWLASGKWSTPLQFARTYYDHYPYLAIGYWPPLFNVVTGVWMLLAGVGRAQALMIPAICAAGTAWLVFRFVREHAGPMVGLCAGFAYLSIPAVREWMCTVMVDHMTAFLVLLAGYSFVRYARNTSLFNSCLLGTVCGLAILSKYSAAYAAGLPFLAILVRRNWRLLADWRLWAGSAITAGMVLPWILFTKEKALCCTIGLLPNPEPLNVHRVSSWVLESFHTLPPVLRVAVCVGLLLLIFRRRIWAEDTIALAYLYAGHLGLFIIAPVLLESRYMLATSAVLVAGAFVGWSSLFRDAERRGLSKRVLPVVMTVATIALAFLQFSPTPMGSDRIRPVVRRIVNDPWRAQERIVVPPAEEGSTIAEFVLQTRQRPSHFLLRPSKILAHMDWNAVHYTSLFSTPEELMEYFQKNPVDLVIWDRRPEVNSRQHAVLMGEMLKQYPSHWHEIFAVNSPMESDSDWVVYEYSAGSH